MFNPFRKKEYKLSQCFQDYCDKASAEMRLARSSLAKYQEIFPRVLAILGDVDIGDIDDSSITRLKIAMNQQGLSASYKNHFLNIVRSVLKHASESGIKKVYDYNLIKKFKVIQGAVDCLSDEEVKKFINSIGEKRITDLRLKTATLCLLSSGARIAELMSLNRDDINFETGTASVVCKGAKYNTIIFDPVSLGYIRKYLARRTDDCLSLFATHQTGAVRRWQVNCAERAMRRQGKAVLERRVYPHLWRKVASSKLAFSGAPLSIVSRYLGHSNVSTTQKYYLRQAEFSEVLDAHRKCFSGSEGGDET